MSTASGLLKNEFGTISDLIRAHARERPQAIALRKDAERLEYAQLDQFMDRVAAGLQREGLRAGDIIAICAATSVEYCAVFLGALRAGVAVAPLAPSSTPESIALMARDCDGKILFLDAAVGGTLKGIELPNSLRRIALDGSSAGQPLREWMALAGVSPSSSVVDPSGIFSIIYSSGTTGEPKGIVHSHRMRWLQIARLSAVGGYGASTVTIVSTPLYSNTTLVSFLPTIAAGGKAVLMEKFDPVSFLRLTEEHGRRTPCSSRSSTGASWRYPISTAMICRAS